MEAVVTSVGSRPSLVEIMNLLRMLLTYAVRSFGVTARVNYWKALHWHNTEQCVINAEYGCVKEQIKATERCQH